VTVVIENLVKKYGDIPVLSGLNLTLKPGVTCLMAPSGAGKTTLIRILLGLEKQGGGTITGLEHARLSAVFQDDRLLLHWDALDNLRFALGKLSNEKSALDILEELGLSDWKGKPVQSFSGGMKRRLALARAVSVPFDFLALDEPFTGLDDDNRLRAAHALKRRILGKTVLLVSHDAGDAEVLGAKVVGLS
jgi:NitT/TauT family transport system ATP-binding protein